MNKRSKSIGARKANDQLSIVRKHYAKMFQIIIEYGILTPEIDRADCVCDLAEIESALMDMEGY